MLRGIGISLIVLASCAWIVFVGWDAFYGTSKTLNPAQAFSKELDETVLKINYPEELNSFALFESDNDYLNLAPNKLEGLVLYFSKKRSYLIIESSTYWSDIAINDLIFNSKLKKTELRAVSGKYLLFSMHNLTSAVNTELDIEDADKNATANIFDFVENKRTDVYLKTNGALSYQTYAANNVLGQAVDDQALFAELLPSKITEYHFQSHFLALKKDSVYSNSLMSDWVNTGFVRAKMDGETFLISDYKAQQDPNLIMLQSLQDIDSLIQENGIHNYKNVQLTKGFPSNPKNGFYVLLLSDKVVLTQSAEMAQKIKLNYQLGNTLAVNKIQQEKVFNALTTKTHERIFNSKQKESTTYTSKIVYTVKADLTTVNSKQAVTSTFSFLAQERISCITPIKDHLRKGVSTFIIAGKTYYLVDAKGKEIWSGQLDTVQTSAVKVVDIYQNNKKQLIFTNGNKLHVLDLNGNAVNGFPYINTALFTTSVAHAFHTNQTRFLAGDKTGKLIYLNAKGGELNVFKLDESPLLSPPILHSKGAQLNGYIATSEGVKMVFLDQNTIQDLQNDVSSVIQLKNQLYFNQIEAEKINILNADFSVLNSVSSDLKIHAFNLSKYALNQLHIYNRKGEIQFESSIQLSEVSDVKQISTQSNQYTLILDDVENNLYLFDRAGELVSGFPKEGQRLIDLNAVTETQFNVYTTLDNNLICYSIHL